MIGTRTKDSSRARRFVAGVFACLFVLQQLFALPALCSEPAQGEAHVSVVASVDAALCDARAAAGKPQNHSGQTPHCCVLCDATAHPRALAPRLTQQGADALYGLRAAAPRFFRADGAAPQPAGRVGAWSSRAPPARV